MLSIRDRIKRFERINRSRSTARCAYDPFLGSGTTLVAAHQLGRIGYGVELDDGYCAVALQRLAVLGLVPRLTGEE